MRRYAARTDANQAAIVDELRALGISVYVLRDPVDLLLWHWSTGHRIVEVKDPTDKRKQKVRSAKQAEFLLNWPGPVPVCETTEQVLVAIGFTRA